MGAKKRILVICPAGVSEQVIRDATKSWPVLEIILCCSVEEARSHLRDSDVHLIFCQNCLTNETYRDLMLLLENLGRDIPVILVVPEEDREFSHQEAIERGVFDIVASPCTRRDVQWMIIRTIQHLKALESHFRAKASFATGQAS